MVDIERWRDLFERAGCRIRPDEQFNNLVNAYSEKHRTYHNLDHIAYCLTEFDRAAKYLVSPDLVEMAIWYHDAIYNTRSKRNEEESALLAERALNALGIVKASIKTVRDLILSTKHNEAPEDSDAHYLMDIDLSILGAAPLIFKEYNDNIRKEYRWVPNFLFRKERNKVLRSFLGREHIFYTDLFRQKYELYARININSVLTN